jgi:meso-butanediol dehydrogenase/(S,S)-butanediol dehydrogenase/diacetyl reductase
MRDSGGVASGITVNCLCPGWMRTSRVDFDALGERAGVTAMEAESAARSDSALRMILEPEQLCGMALLLTGPVRGAASTGQVVNVDGGYRL